VVKTAGTDVINNASSDDVVCFYDASTSIDTSNNKISIGLNTGSNFEINSSENVSAKITMQEGSVIFNHSTNTWKLGNLLKHL